MTMTHIRRVLVASATLVTLSAFAPAHAVGIQAGVQILDPSGACASWTPGGTTAAPTLTCVASAPPVAGAPSCTLAASTQSISAAQSVVLTAACTNTNANTTWAWSGAGTTASQTGASQQVQNVTVSATTTFSVIATNATGPSTSKSVTVTLTPPGGGGGGAAGGGISCPGFSRTFVVDLNYVPGTQPSQVADAFTNTDVVVARFTTPANLTTLGQGGYVTVAEYGGPTTKRTAVLSTTACSFATPNLGKQVTSWPNIAFGGTTAPLQPNTTYFLNIKNANSSDVGSCSGNCPIIVKLTPN